jgi:hypothetical protein
MLEHFCDKRLPLDAAHSQVANGLELPEDINNRGMDVMGWMYGPIFIVLHQMGSSKSASDGSSSAKNKGPSFDKAVGRSCGCCCQRYSNQVMQSPLPITGII